MSRFLGGPAVLMRMTFPEEVEAVARMVEEDLIPLLEGARDMDVPIIGITDKEKAQPWDPRVPTLNPALKGRPKGGRTTSEIRGGSQTRATVGASIRAGMRPIEGPNR